MKIDTKRIVSVGRNYVFEFHPKRREPGVRSLQSGTWHPVMQAMALRQAKYQAKLGVQGHQHWAGERDKELARAFPECDTFSEIVAESWPDQNLQDAAVEMYRSWERSPGHWHECDIGHTYWGYAMARSTNGIWYSAGVFGERR